MARSKQASEKSSQQNFHKNDGGMSQHSLISSSSSQAHRVKQQDILADFQDEEDELLLSKQLKGHGQNFPKAKNLNETHSSQHSYKNNDNVNSSQSNNNQRRQVNVLSTNKQKNVNSFSNQYQNVNHHQYQHHTNNQHLNINNEMNQTNSNYQLPHLTQNYENDMSLGQLINNTSIPFDNQNTFYQQRMMNNQMTLNSVGGGISVGGIIGMRQDELLSISGASQSFARDNYHRHDSGENYDNDDDSDPNRSISAHDVQDQFKDIRQELEKVRKAKKQMKKFMVEQNNSIIDDSRFMQDNMSQSEDFNPSAIEKKYKFLMQGQVFKTLDAPNINNQDLNPVIAKNGIPAGMVTSTNILELNNKLIEETYFLSKKREYVQLHMEESDLSILDIDKIKDINGLVAHKRKYSNLGGGLGNPLTDISNQGEDRQDELATNIDIQLITNHDRLQVTIPNYDNHSRLYFENPDGFAQNQEIRLNQRKVFTKVTEEKSVEFEKRLFHQFARMNQSEQVDMIGKIVPQFADCLRDLQQFKLKYQVLLDRVKKLSPLPLKQALAQDRVLESLGILNDLQKGDQVPQLQQQQTLSGTNAQREQRDNVRRSQNDSLKQKTTKDDESIREIQRIKEQLGGAEQKLKDAQLSRLQEKVKGFAQTEKQLRQQLNEVESRDESLISKIESAVCFGKVMLSLKPVVVRSMVSIQSSVQYNAIDKQFQVESVKSGANSSSNLKKEKEMGLIDRIDNSISSILEQEFNELYNELKSYKLNLQSKFCLLTDEHIYFYSDIYMLQELYKFHLSTLDFIDLGIVLQNNQVNKRVFFMKMIHQNLEEKQREVYLISVYEDQIYKWDNTLEPQDDIKYQDRTFQIIKSRLLKVGMNQFRGKDDQFDEDDGGHSDSGSQLQRQDGEVQRYKQGSYYKSGRMKNNRKATILIDDNNESSPEGGQRNNPYSDNENGELQSLERQFHDNLKNQTRRLEEVGLNVEHPLNNQNERNPLHFQDISGTEDLQKAMDDLNDKVQQKIKQKVQQQQKEERDRSIEQQKRKLEKQQIQLEYIKAFKVLAIGTTFLKYGAMGQPKYRHIFLSENGKILCWKDPGAQKSKSQILIKDIQKITHGRDTKKFKRFKNTTEQQLLVSFSIHTKKRTLDLEAANLKDKEEFLSNLNVTMKLINDPKISQIKKIQQI
ncbi:UNKNOWN [Stylonychia lemnae]|uniref:PH domain-containing protein n=1 Tax=Stylonychia lemnae TaxID=5949 RepID=A0A078A8C3_STYLE|nr:UNKNOWN [Stylonychia lemnae]|eukprot:CDW77822.1 UNKNOWN [Stylonychia lemnae]